MTRRPIFLIVNPVSGGKPGSGPDLADDPQLLTPDALADALRRRGLEVTAHPLAEEDQLRELAADAAARGCDVVAAGGDGTVGQVAAALVGSDATLGILAAGSFNNVARGFRVPTTLEPALDAIGRGEATAFDVGIARHGADDEEQPFFEAAGVGLDAVGFLAVELGERRGWWRAARAVWRGLRRRRSPMRLTIDGVQRATAAPAVTISNGPYHGLGFAIAPDADPRDGLLDVAVFAGMNRLEVLGHFLAVARRNRPREPRVRLLRARTIRVEGVLAAHPVHVDGISIGFTPVTFEVRPRALRVFR